MSDQRDNRPAETQLDGTEVPAETVAAKAKSPSVVAKVVRASLYGVMLLAVTALAAVSAVPELSNYVPFIPDAKRPEPDPELVARLMARQQAYLRSACITDDGLSENSVTEEPALEDSSSAEPAAESAAIPTDDQLTPEAQPGEAAADSAPSTATTATAFEETASE